MMSGLRMERPFDRVNDRTLRAVRSVTDFEVALFRSDGWVVLRGIWDPEDEENMMPSRLQTLANFEKDLPRDDAQYELAAALAARMLRAPALSDPAGGNGLDNAFDHFDFAHCLDVAPKKYALLVMPTELTLVGLQGYSSGRLTASSGALEEESPTSATTDRGFQVERDAREFELGAGDVLILDDTCSRGCPLGIGGDQLVYRFVACGPGSRGVLWRPPPEIGVLATMGSQGSSA